MCQINELEIGILNYTQMYGDSAITNKFDIERLSFFMILYEIISKKIKQKIFSYRIFHIFNHITEMCLGCVLFNHLYKAICINFF